MGGIVRALLGGALGAWLIAACSTEPATSRTLLVRAAVGLDVPSEAYAVGIYTERLDADGETIQSGRVEVTADDTHFLAPLDVVPDVGARPGDRVRVTVVAYAPPDDGWARPLAMRRAELAWPAEGRMLRLGLTKDHVNNVEDAKYELPVPVGVVASFSHRRCSAHETEDDGAHCVPLTSVALDLPAVDPKSPPPEACLPAACFDDGGVYTCNYEPCRTPALSYRVKSLTPDEDGSCSLALPERLDERGAPAFRLLEHDLHSSGAGFHRLLTPEIDFTFDPSSRTVTFSRATCSRPNVVELVASARCEPPPRIATAQCGTRVARNAVPMTLDENAFAAGPNRRSREFQALPLDEPPSMLAVVGEGSDVHAVLGSESRLWLRPGSSYYEGHEWRPAVSFERDGAPFRALYGYTAPSESVAEGPRVYVAQRDGSLRPVTLEGIGAPVRFCTAPSSCRSTADVVSVAEPNGSRGAVWMVRDPEGLAFYLEESPTRFVRTALTPIAGASRVLELVDDPPDIATVIERDGTWGLLRLSADAATVREELPLPVGPEYVHLARGRGPGHGDTSGDALHVLVAGEDGGEAALEIDAGGVSLSFRWRGSVPGDAPWYGRSVPAWNEGGGRFGCYLAATELICRDAAQARTLRTADVFAAQHHGAHLFALREEAAGSYLVEKVANYGPSLP